MHATSAELILIRHAPALADGRLAGWRDVPADVSDTKAMARLRAWIGEPAQVIVSPALRCSQTAHAVFPAADAKEDKRLWEQNFGDHEGLRPDELPDLGVLPRSELAKVAPPNGESFLAMVERAGPALLDLADQTKQAGPIAVVAHAGTVRAGLALALDSVAAALAFEAAPLSATKLRCFDGGLSVICTNVTP